VVYGRINRGINGRTPLILGHHEFHVGNSNYAKFRGNREIPWISIGGRGLRLWAKFIVNHGIFSYEK
jgi:hypothetical protein